MFVPKVLLQKNIPQLSTNFFAIGMLIQIHCPPNSVFFSYHLPVSLFLNERDIYIFMG